MRKCFGRLLTFEVLKAANKLADDVDMADAKEKSIKAISLEATDMGRPLYERFGFVKMNDEMELPEHRVV